LHSLSVVLLSVSESDSELLSDSLELPEPPLAGTTDGGCSVAKGGLKKKMAPFITSFSLKLDGHSPAQHKGYRQSGIYYPHFTGRKCETPEA
jgi:hypothetical protein